MLALVAVQQGVGYKYGLKPLPCSGLNDYSQPKIWSVAGDHNIPYFDINTGGGGGGEGWPRKRYGKTHDSDLELLF